MRKVISILIFALLASVAGAQTADQDLLVTMPVPPKTITRLDERCNYIIEHYWKTFNPKSSFSNLDKLNKTLGTFFDVTPYATADTVHLAIDRLLEAVNKAKPDNLVTLAELAERWCYSDTSEYLSEELYFPFVEAVATNKKVKSPLKARFATQYKQILNSRVGTQLKNFEYILPDGTRVQSDSIKAPQLLIVFYDPECTDCRLAKARLSADFVLNSLIDNDILTIMALYPDEPTEEWKADAESMPKNWVVGALPNADEMFTMRVQPEIYYMDKSRRIAAKDVNVDNIMAAFRMLLESAADVNTPSETQPGEAQPAAPQN